MSSISGAVRFAGAWIGASLTSGQPFRDPESDLVLVMDGRIDGKHGLRDACAAAGHAPRSQADEELVLRAYEAWGESCPARILGDYAFAIWDQNRGRLFCARDSGGVRPFFYALPPDGCFCFAGGDAQIPPALSLPLGPDDAGIVDFLIGRGALLPDRSPLRSIRRLPPAHALTFDASGLRVSRYWSVNEASPARFSNRAEALEACATALQQAVRDRTEGAGRCGVSLSGGWDSGAVFAVLQSLRGRHPHIPEPWFYTYYGDSPDADERAEVRELLRVWPAIGEFVALDPNRGLDGLEEHCAQLGMPEPASGWRWVTQCAAAARSAGVTRILTGEAGNEVFQSSILRPADWLRSGRFLAAYRQAQAWGRDAETSLGSFVWPFVIRPALAAYFPAIRGAARAARVTQSSGPMAYLTDSSRELALDMISQANARNQPRPRGTTLSAWDKSTALRRWCGDLFPMPAGPELDGVTLTAPFLDRRVTESALAALDFETRAGSTRQLLASTVESVTGRPFHGRHAHYTDLLERMLRHGLSTNARLFDAAILVELGIVDAKRVKAFVDGFRAGRAAALGPLWRLVSAEAWARIF